jgi:hypothetical protein
MPHRLAYSIGAAAVAVFLAATGPVIGQTKAGPRTPWGDPDLQGTYTNTYENGTPFERPDEFAGRKLDDVTGDELKAIKRAQQQRTIAAFLGPEHAPDNWWQDNLSLERGSQAWFIIDPEDGKIPPMTPEARQRIAARAEARKRSGRGPADSYEDRSLYDRCITRGLPGSMLPAIYGNQYQIVQAPGFIAITYEMIHETRVVPLDPSTLREPQGRPEQGRGATGEGPPQAESRGGSRSLMTSEIEQDMGVARGHWEGDTLVIETTNFKERSAYRNANAATLKLTERFQRVAPDKVRWTVTVDDPKTWTRPWTFSLPLTADANPLPLYECHEGNYGLKNILSAARAEERARKP